MLDRIQECEENGPGCDFPLSWSISPHLLYLAPDWLLTTGISGDDTNTSYLTFLPDISLSDASKASK